ncbi:(2Fe-2S)-binding protein [Ramlibacter sp.]|uniref:(2Fe-2S)-binding protein n=1 Tax=Ramlibacter sp. TaxID=1917967 RepID=UPI003D12BECF
MEDRHEIRLTVNSQACAGSVDPRLNLVDFLRYEGGLTGTHVGCEHGVCGACTVLVDGRSVRGCLMLAVQADGCEVRTVESLGTAAQLNPLQQAFAQCHALQCGFCTPGILMTVTEFMEKRDVSATVTEAEIREMLSGNLCRCTGYQGIVDAVAQALRHAGATVETSPLLSAAGAHA